MKKVIADPSLVRNDFFVPPIKPDKFQFTLQNRRGSGSFCAVDGTAATHRRRLPFGLELGHIL